jgi:hypothetical protein
VAPGSSFLGPASPQCTCRRRAGCHVVLVVRNARHSTEAKGTRPTPKEPDRPAAMMPRNAWPSSAATGARRAVKRRRPVGYVTLPDARRVIPDRQHAMLRNDHLNRTTRAATALGSMSSAAMSSAQCHLTAADNGSARFPSSYRHHGAPPSIFRDRCGIRLCRTRLSIQDPGVPPTRRQLAVDLPVRR